MVTYGSETRTLSKGGEIVSFTYDYAKLRGKIKEVVGTEQMFAQKLGICRGSLYMRLQNKLDFSRDEMIRACDLLGIEYSEMATYFFAEKVQKNEHVC
jgi:hypothetical protein